MGKRERLKSFCLRGRHSTLKKDRHTKSALGNDITKAGDQKKTQMRKMPNELSDALFMHVYE